jgi:hypothetical protein
MMVNLSPGFNRLPGAPMSDTSPRTTVSQDASAAKRISPAAERALREAEARRKAYRDREASLPKEIGGRGGNEPGRYGDWEIKGLTSDF